jgi:hypothetical protein
MYCRASDYCRSARFGRRQRSRGAASAWRSLDQESSHPGTITMSSDVRLLQIRSSRWHPSGHTFACVWRRFGGERGQEHFTPGL